VNTSIHTLSLNDTNIGDPEVDILLSALQVVLTVSCEYIPKRLRGAYVSFTRIKCSSFWLRNVIRCLILIHIIKIAQNHRTVKHLSLGSNNIQILPYGLVHLGLLSLSLDGNFSLQFPPKSIASQSDALIAFFNDLIKDGSVKVTRTKLMLMGHGRAGKSTLAKALTLQAAALHNLLQELKDKAGMCLAML